MIQAAPKPSAKKIPRTASKGSQAQVRYTSAKNKMPESQASTGSAQNRGDHSRPVGVRGVEASEHREGQEEPSQERSHFGSTGLHREYDGSDIRVVAGQVPNRRTIANTIPTRISTPSPGAQERMREAHTQRIARRQALRQEEAAGASTATPVIDNRSNFQHPQHGVIQSLLSINNNNTAGLAHSWADTADDDVPVIDREHQYSETPVNSPMDVDWADAPMVRDSIAPPEADPRAAASDDPGADDDDEWMDIPVAVVAAGWKDADADQVRTLLHDSQDWKGWNLVPHLKRDPHRDGGIGHHQSGRNSHTQRQVFKQEGFPGIIEWIVSWILDFCVWPQQNVGNRMDSGGLGLVLWCNHGWHRSDTAMRKVQEVLNSLHWPNGARIFNCGIFALNERLGNREAQQAMLDEAVEWVQRPWEMTESTFSMPKSMRYGCWACMNDPRARENFNQLWEWEQGRLRQDVLKLLGNRFPPESRETKRLRREPLSDHRQSQATGTEDVEGTWRNLWVLHETHSPVIWIDGVMYSPVNQSMIGERIQQVPEWASISFDAEVWWKHLIDLKIDDAAIENFFRLAQAHEQAAWLCSELLTKLVRKHACHDFGPPHQSPKRASKWFHRSCCNAREVLTACLDGEWWATPQGVKPVPGAQEAYEAWREARRHYRPFF